MIFIIIHLRIYMGEVVVVTGIFNISLSIAVVVNSKVG